MTFDQSTITALFLTVIGTILSITGWLARGSFEEMKTALVRLTATIHEMDTNHAVLAAEVRELERRVTSLEGKVQQRRREDSQSA
jgi:cell division protein FtsB